MLSDNQRDNRGDVHPDTRGETQACELTTELPFGLACRMTCVLSGARPDVRGDARVEPRNSPQGAFCDYGLSALQINVLALIQRAGARVTPYKRIARKLAQEFGMQQSAESVRGVVNRLTTRGFFRHKQARNGTTRGVSFTTVEALFCPHIIGTRAGVRGDVQAEALLESSRPLSILKEKRDRENLSISSEEDGNRIAARKLEALTEDDIAYHWPNLARMGFSTCQIRQVLERLAQVNMSAEKVLQGLTHAEWEFANGTMRDKSGQPITNPVNWVFTILAKQGYYRRPEGYISPQEQAELDAAKEEKRIAEAREAHKKAACDAWVSKLSPEDRSSIVAPPDNRNRMPEDTALRLHFTAHVWPEILAGRCENGSSHEV